MLRQRSAQVLDLRSFGQAQDRFWIFDCRRKTQSVWIVVDLLSCSPNRKSKIQNRKWLGLSGIAFVLVVTGAVATAQQPAKVEPAKIPKIGWLSARGGSNIGQETIIRMLRDLGYVEGKSVAFEYRFADNKLDRLPSWPMNWSVSRSMSSSRPGLPAP
jgi:hypothetical protein